MARRVCNVAGCPTITDGPRCDEHARPNANARGYGSRHQGTRASWQARIDAGETVTCWRPDCDTVLTGRAWHLGHDDLDRSITRGPECTPCNLSAAGRNSHMS